jgi:DNA-binding HxlR family transcriptional regulator
MTDPCAPFETAIRLLGRRWAGAVVRAMLGGARRFGEIRADVPGITDAVLTTRLRELCALGLATREVTDGPPVLVEYLLTPAGRDLRPVLNAVERYGVKHQQLLEARDGRSGGR